MKILCRVCRKRKSSKQFAKNRARPTGRQYRCRECASDYSRNRYANDPEYRVRQAERLRKRNKRFPDYMKEYNFKYLYGLSLENHGHLLDAFENSCFICGGSSHLCIDHKEGIIRGILCRQCNLAIGQFSDDAYLLERAIIYLEEVAPRVS